jgi:hypothetical protein
LIPIAILIGALIKTWFIGLTVYLLLMRKWKMATLTVGSFVGMMFLLFVPLGFSEWHRFCTVTTGFLTKHVEVYKPAQSFLGFARIHLAQNTWVEPLIASPVLYWGFIAVGLGILTAGLLFAFRREALSAYESHLQLGLVVCSMLLSMPHCDMEYLVLTIPLLWTLLIPSALGLKSAPRWSPIAALLMFIVGTRIHWGCTSAPVPPWLKHGLMSLLISDGFFWLCALWIITILSFVAVRRNTTVSIDQLENQAGYGTCNPPLTPVSFRETPRIESAV